MFKKLKNFLLLAVFLMLSVFLVYGYISGSNITLHYPTNGAIVDNSGGDIDFNCSAISNSTYDNINLTIWTNLTGSWEGNISLSTNVTNNTIQNLSYAFAGDYNLFWGCQANDSEGSYFSSSNYTITIDTQAPSAFTLGNFSANVTNTTDNTPTLNWSLSTDLTFVNYTIFIFNNITMNSTTLERSALEVASATTDYVTLSALDDGTYYWYVTAYDNNAHATNSSMADSTAWYTFSIDATAPVISSTVNFTNDRVNYTFSSTVDENGFCTLWGNWSGSWAMNETKAVTADTAFNFTPINFSIFWGPTYMWGINCSDAVGSESNTVWSSNYTITLVDRIKPTVPTNVSTGYYMTTVTDIADIRWSSVVTDIEGNDDGRDITYLIWRSTVAPVNTSARANESEGFVNIKNVTNTNYTTDDLGVTGTYYYLITTDDDQHNSNFSILNDTANGVNFQSFSSVQIVVPSSTSGGSSSGGSGGGTYVSPTTSVSTSVANIKKSYIWSEIVPETPAIMRISEEAMALKRLEVTVRNRVTSVGITVLQADEAFASVEPLEHAYKYFEIESLEVLNDNIQTSYIYFEVPKTWLEQYDEESVKMVKFVNNEWVPISTSRVVDQGTSVQYMAQTAGFSFYAITAELAGQAEPTEETVAEETTMEETAEEVTETTVSYAWAWLLVGVLFIVGLVWYYMKE